MVAFAMHRSIVVIFERQSNVVKHGASGEIGGGDKARQHADIGCQAVNLRLLPFSCRALFDDEYRLQCKAYGVPKWRRDMHWGFIRLWGTIRKHEDSPAKYAKVYDFKVLE